MINPSLPPPAHPLVWRLPFHLSRRAITALCTLGFVEANQRRKHGQVAELVRLEDGAAVTVARGAGADVLLLPSRPWPQITSWEAHP